MGKLWLLLMGLVLLGSVNAGWYWNTTLITANSSSSYLIGATNLKVYNDVLFVSSLSADRITAYNISDPKTMRLLSSVTKSIPPSSLDQVRGFRYDEQRKIIAATASVDDAITLINASNVSALTYSGMGSTATLTVNPYSLDNVYDIALFTINNNHFLMTSGIGTDTLTVLNITNPSIVSNQSYRVTNSGTCTTDSIRNFAVDYERGIVWGSSFDDDYVLAYNITQFLTPSTNITCIASRTDSTTPYNQDGTQGMYYDNETRLLYVTSYNGNELTLLNTSNPTSLTPIGYAMNSTIGANNSLWRAIDVAVDTIEGQKFAFVASSGNGTAGFYGKITIINVTTPTTPVIIGSLNYSSGTCLNKGIQELVISNHTLHYISYTDNCYYAVQLYTITEETPSTSCTCPGSGTWEWDFADNCNITADCSAITTVQVKNTNAGTWKISAVITATNWFLNGTIGQYINGLAGGYLKQA